MIVLALFDGISCGHEALMRAGKPVTKYYASEIDKYALTIARKRYPQNIQLGDVRAVRKMAEAGVFGWVDLLIAGSPCQGFSFAGKQLAFNDPRSQLFFEFLWTLQALRKINPNIKFMLENVSMKKEFLDIITNFLGVQPVKINSALVSAQNRVRYYWCNWTVTQPADRGIYLRDIIVDGEVDRDKALTLMHGYADRGGNSASDVERYHKNQMHQLVKCVDGPKRVFNTNPSGRGMNGWVYDTDAKAPALTTNKGEGNKIVDKRAVAGISLTPNGIRPYKNDGHMGSFSEIGTIATPDHKSGCLTSSNTPKITTGGAVRGRYVEGNSGPTRQGLEVRDDGKANALTLTEKDSVLVQLPVNDYIEPQEYSARCQAQFAKNARTPDDKALALHDNANATGSGVTILKQYPRGKNPGFDEPRDKTPAMGAHAWEHNLQVSFDSVTYRKLYVVECERLQTLPDGYTEGVSNTQRYKCLGNGWNVETIVHILQCMPPVVSRGF